MSSLFLLHPVFDPIFVLLSKLEMALHAFLFSKIETNADIPSNILIPRSRHPSIHGRVWLLYYIEPEAVESSLPTS